MKQKLHRKVTLRATSLPVIRLLRAAFAILCLGLVSLSQARANTWAERLGFPAEKKVVILHARDLGLCYETNAAAEQLLEQGLVQSASAMAPCPWFADSAAWAVQNPTLDVGLQLTLNSELPSYRWQPVAPHSLVTHLVDHQGFFWPTVMQTTVNGHVDDIEHEMEAQLQRARLAGLVPSHLTTHLGTLYSRPDFARAYLRFARRHWIPAVVVELTPERLDSFRRQGFPLPDDLLQLLNEYPLPKVDDLKFLPEARSADEKRRLALELFASLSPGITQIAVAPAIETDAMKRLDSQWQRRVWEFELFSDQDFRDNLATQDVIITNWREIMQRFEGRKQ